MYLDDVYRMAKTNTEFKKTDVSETVIMDLLPPQHYASSGCGRGRPPDMENSCKYVELVATEDS
jgi:hypothetical protein